MSFTFPISLAVSKFLPCTESLTIIVSADGYVAACMDVLQITHAAISLVNFTSEIHKNYR